MYKGYLIDLDGVAYLGKEVIPTCRDFIIQLNQKKIKYCFVTNNSTRTTLEVCEHLNEIGYPVTPQQIITSSEVTAHYIKKEKSDALVHLIGMQGITSELLQQGLKIVEKNADYVVTGLDTEITYDKMIKACHEILHGARFISTNSDLRLNTSTGIAPGNGALTKVIELATGVTPLYMGKPECAMFLYGLEKLGLEKHEVAMIGDNYFTDIIGAIQFGMDSIFVETGIMTMDDLKSFDLQPTIKVRNLLELDI